MNGGGKGWVGWRYVIMLDRWYFWATVKANGGGEGWVGSRYGIMLDMWYFWAIVKANGGGVRSANVAENFLKKFTESHYF